MIGVVIRHVQTGANLAKIIEKKAFFAVKIPLM